MVISEKVKLVGLTALLGGGGVLLFKSATQSAHLREAIDCIRTAQDSIAAAKHIIDGAKNDINSVRGELKSLQEMAGKAQINLEALRQERQQLEKSINQTLSTGRQVLDNQRALVFEFQKQKQKEDAKVDSISQLITSPFNKKNGD